MAEYLTLLTTIGAATLANAIALGEKVSLTKVAVGDANGEPYQPTEDSTQLKNKTWEGQINHLYQDSDNPSYLIAEIVVPQNVGGWTIREAAILDADGNIFAITRYPDTYKPQLAEGAAKDLWLRFVMKVGNVGAVQLIIDPAQVLATRKYVDDIVNISFDEHNADTNAHPLLNSYDIPFMAGWGGDGTGEDIAMQSYGAVLVPRDIAIEDVTAQISTAPTGSALIVDVLVNGSSIFSTKPRFADGITDLSAGELANAPTLVAAGDRVEMKVTQVGSTTPGQKLLVSVKGKAR